MAQRAQIVEESFGEADSVCAVARRHELSSTQLFAWRKAAREMALSAFVPVLVEPSIASPPAVAMRLSGVQLGASMDRLDWARVRRRVARRR